MSQANSSLQQDVKRTIVMLHTDPDKEEYGVISDRPGDLFSDRHFTIRIGDPPHTYRVESNEIIDQSKMKSPPFNYLKDGTPNLVRVIKVASP